MKNIYILQIYLLFEASNKNVLTFVWNKTIFYVNVQGQSTTHIIFFERLLRMAYGNTNWL